PATVEEDQHARRPRLRSAGATDCERDRGAPARARPRRLRGSTRERDPSPHRAAPRERHDHRLPSPARLSRPEGVHPALRALPTRAPDRGLAADARDGSRLDGEPELSEHLDRASLPALEVARREANPRRELVSRSEDRLRRVTPLL